MLPIDILELTKNNLDESSMSHRPKKTVKYCPFLVIGCWSPYPIVVITEATKIKEPGRSQSANSSCPAVIMSHRNVRPHVSIKRQLATELRGHWLSSPTHTQHTERTTDGVILPTPTSHGVGTPHQHPRDNENRSGWWGGGTGQLFAATPPAPAALLKSFGSMSHHSGARQHAFRSRVVRSRGHVRNGVRRPRSWGKRDSVPQKRRPKLNITTTFSNTIRTYSTNQGIRMSHSDEREREREPRMAYVFNKSGQSCREQFPK